ncbi:hypothetical protein QBC35DRAFT_525060 [Podospora australis]|uniref:Uncharacterized protein n=1 Tax=Podospora australis TaxID=1536484 RepID=A0AAN7AE47_9PEZI|nr:hypothetical protein QBC35DRAFT_525060 [Podospora australis]
METHELDECLYKYPISATVQNSVIDELWGAEGLDDTGEKSRNISLLSYFDYYAERVQRNLLAGHEFGLQNHADIVWVGQSEPSDMDDAIDLCASLLTMTEVEFKQNLATRLSGRTPLVWEENSLQDLLDHHFAPQTQLCADNGKLGKLFTARNLDRISGISIKWTTNLTDHLRLTDDDRVVLVFQCASFLKLQDSLGRTLLPKSLMKETLNTLALLFPSTDEPTREWLQKQRKSASIDAQLNKCGALRTRERRIENFSIWHDRLVILKQAFDESQPASISQWWFDRRNTVQWYTFWIAVLVFAMTMFFGLVQSVLAAIQVYISYKNIRSGRQLM